MLQIPFSVTVLAYSLLWIVIRAACCIVHRRFDPKRELQLLLVYISIAVVIRFTFFPFARVDGRIQPLMFDASRLLPLNVRLIPLVHLIDYPSMKDILVNVVGNVAMFVPIGIVWPSVYKELRFPLWAILAGFGFSLSIELLQLLFYTRVSDVDDLILNSLGFLIGYGIYLLAKQILQKAKRRKK